MYYSITFTYDMPTSPLFFSKDDRVYPLTSGSQRVSKNTWIDWHLVPTERPSINTPEVKTKTVDVPGMNGVLDLTESLSGYPTYKNRTGSIDFMVLTGYEAWNEVYQDMCSYFHGRKVYFACEDDPGYYYHGRITVNQYQSQKDNSKISIDYEIEPYKYGYHNGRVGAYWDIFDFDSDNMEGVKFTDKFHSIAIDSEEYVDICSGSEWGNYSEMPIIPTIKVSTPAITDSVTIHFVNQEMGIDYEKTLTAGKYQLPQIIFTQIKNVGKKAYFISLVNNTPYDPVPIEYKDMGYTGNSMTLEAKGKGTLSIWATPGRM